MVDLAATAGTQFHEFTNQFTRPRGTAGSGHVAMGATVGGDLDVINGGPRRIGIGSKSQELVLADDLVDLLVLGWREFPGQLRKKITSRASSGSHSQASVVEQNVLGSLFERVLVDATACG